MKKRILLTAGGTATTWHFCNIIKEYFANDYEVYITDTNDDYLVPASIFVKKENFFKVPSVFENNYYETMLKILKDNKIDIIVPLIDFDLYTFANDNEDLKALNVYSTAPKLHTTELLSNKEELFKFLSSKDIMTPRLYEKSELNDEDEYIIKPKTGFGSIGVTKESGYNIKNMSLDRKIIQELCEPEEITAEVYNGKSLHVFQRLRVATKSGVCVKMIPQNHPEINNAIQKLVASIECPKAFCIQFMKNKDGKWCIIDCNLRIGAGTALSTKIGFQLVRALLTDLLNKEVEDSLFSVDTSIKSVLRVYDEVAIR